MTVYVKDGYRPIERSKLTGGLREQTFRDVEEGLRNGA